MQQFDPNIPGLIEGNITTVVVIDPTNTFPPFEVGNHVLNRNDSFQINVEWTITGLLGPLWLSALGGNWNVQVFAESLGGGPEILLARDDSVAADPNIVELRGTAHRAADRLGRGRPGQQRQRDLQAGGLGVPQQQPGKPGLRHDRVQRGPHHPGGGPGLIGELRSVRRCIQMGDSLASFRDLKGIGPATEARLHEAGIYTWEALAAAATALAAVRGEGDTLRDVANAVAARRAEAGKRAPLSTYRAVGNASSRSCSGWRSQPTEPRSAAR